ncbi:MAG: glycosyltransferase [marine benthic group bacterium]|nr:glycosyltransferase [Gemmatimonadota bacterium]
MPIRIVYLIDSLGMGGAERVLLSNLEHLDRGRFEPRVAVLQQRGGNPLAGEIQKLGIPVDMVWVERLRDPRALPRVIRYLRASRADLLHTQLEFSIILGGVAARVLRIPCVSTLHTFNVPAPGTRDAWRAKLNWWSLRRMNTMVITVSEAGRLHHLDYGRLPPDRVITMYNGVDLAAFGPRDEPAGFSLRHKLGIQPDAPVIVTVAVLRKPKGHRHLIGALAGILPSMPDTKLVIVGDGDEGPALRRQATDLQLDGHVVFTGARSDIADLLAMSNLFVLPTLDDVLPTVVAEAMAAGLPVVASNVGGLPEMVVDGVTGLLVPPADEEALADACLELLTNRRKAHVMGLAGRDVARERFDVKHQSELLGDLYVSMLRADNGVRGSRTSST